MRILTRLKRLWELSGEDLPEKAPSFTGESRKKKAKKMATVLQEDPLDVFPSEEHDNDKTSERPSTN